MQNHDAVYFAIIVSLPVLVRLLMVPRIGEPVHAASLRVGERLWAHLSEREQPDDLVLRRWALDRLDLLQERLDLVRRLVLTDDDMSATRQLGNRLAYERLKLDVEQAEANAPEPLDEPTPPTTRWRPEQPERSVAARVVTQKSNIETIELGPSGRWF